MVLNHKYYDMLRRKYKLPTVSINLVAEDIPNFPDFREENIDRPSADKVRREVIVHHYLEGEKVQSIADKLGIPTTAHRLWLW